MSDEMGAALIGVAATLAVAIITKITDAFISKFRTNSKIKQKNDQAKRKYLNVVYKTLISAINLFPNASPNDILKCVEYPPYYSMEHFDAILKSLDYQIEDYKKQLEIPHMNYEQKCNIEVQISNREYSKKEISEIRDKYYNAKDKYKSFCESDKVLFDLYAGQDVRNRLVKFEVIIHNVFISGRSVGDVDDPISNIIIAARREVVNSIRNDIGLNPYFSKR